MNFMNGADDLMREQSEHTAKGKLNLSTGGVMNLRESAVLIFIKKDMIPIWIFAALVIVGIILAVRSIFKNVNKKEHSLEVPLSSSPEKREATEEEKRIWRENYSKAQQLAQEMILLVSSESGMEIQRELFCRETGTFTKEIYRQNFLLKQRRLKEIYEEYYVLKEKIEELPENAGRRIEALEDDRLYQEMMNMKL